MTAVYTSHAVSRRLLLGWCAWLLLSWLLHLILDAPGRMWVMLPDGTLVWRVPADAMGAVVSGMFQSVLLGMTVAWPLWRLSTGSFHNPGHETINDVAALWIVAQVVVWPMRLLLNWPVSRLLWMDAVLLIAAVAAGLCVWFGRLPGHAGRRTLAMALCVMVLFGPWVVAYLSGQARVSSLSLLHMLWTICQPDEPLNGAMAVRMGVWVGVLLLGWVAVWAGALARTDLHRTPHAAL